MPNSSTFCCSSRGTAKRRHDQHEDEEVVDREALLGDVAREVLAGVLGRRRTTGRAARRRQRCRRRPPTRSRTPAATARAACARARRNRRRASPTITAIVRAQTTNGDIHRRQASGHWHRVSTGGLSRRTAACRRPTAPEVAGPRDDDAAAQGYSPPRADGGGHVPARIRSGSAPAPTRRPRDRFLLRRDGVRYVLRRKGSIPSQQRRHHGAPRRRPRFCWPRSRGGRDLRIGRR